MNLKKYLQFAKTTAVYPNIGNNWHYPLIGMVGELGELGNKLKKTIRDDNDIITEEKRNMCIDEMGDLAWYFVMLCYELKIDPDMVLENNISKLKERVKNNTVHDTGNRENEISKPALFLDTLKRLEGKERRPVTSTLLFRELIKTGRFTREEGKTYLKTFQREAVIYESKPGYYNKV